MQNEPEVIASLRQTTHDYPSKMRLEIIEYIDSLLSHVSRQAEELATERWTNDEYRKAMDEISDEAAAQKSRQDQRIAELEKALLLADGHIRFDRMRGKDAHAVTDAIDTARAALNQEGM